MNASAPKRGSIERLLAIMARLRDPEEGCPWDLEQDFASIAPYTIEEAYEVAEAIAQADMAALRGELGDLLLQVVFHARMAEEAGHFSFQDVVAGIADKMVKRHPHVFADADIATANAQTLAWEAQKAAERAARARAEGRRPSVLEGVATALPALSRAVKLQNRAARVGFDWPDAEPVFDKVDEEINELRAHLKPDGERDQRKIGEEYGDLLFAVANLARHLGLDPEDSLRAANRKFIRRFRRIEEFLEEQGKRPEQSSLEEMDRLWDRVKREEPRD